MNRRLAQGLEADAARPPHSPVEAVVALGANLGDRAETLTAAITELARLPLVDDVRVSEAIESVALKPEGPDADAPAYLNAVAILTTRLAPSVLLGSDLRWLRSGENPRSVVSTVAASPRPTS